MTTPDRLTPARRYSLTEASRRAGMAHTTLSRMIRENRVPGAYYEPPTRKRGKVGRYYIFAEHFDRWIGLAEPEPVVSDKPLLHKVVFLDDQKRGA